MGVIKEFPEYNACLQDDGESFLFTDTENEEKRYRVGKKWAGMIEKEAKISEEEAACICGKLQEICDEASSNTTHIWVLSEKLLYNISKILEVVPPVDFYRILSELKYQDLEDIRYSDNPLQTYLNF